MFAVFVLVGLLNNIHGHFIMRTVEGTFNTKFFFFTRFMIQCLLIYICACLFLGKELTLGPNLPNPHSTTASTLYKRADFYSDFLLVISIIVFGFVICSAVKLIRIKKNT